MNNRLLNNSKTDINRNVFVVIRDLISKDPIQYSSIYDDLLPIDLEQRGDHQIYLSVADVVKEPLGIITYDPHFVKINNKFSNRYSHVTIYRPKPRLVGIEPFNNNTKKNESLARKILTKIYELFRKGSYQ